jgi:hypothetical protein
MGNSGLLLAFHLFQHLLDRVDFFRQFGQQRRCDRLLRLDLRLDLVHLADDIVQFTDIRLFRRRMRRLLLREPVGTQAEGQ